VIEQALKTAALMLGSDKSRGYMLKQFRSLLIALDRLFGSLPQPKRQEFLDKARMTL
jgi:hypothetical protein